MAGPPLGFGNSIPLFRKILTIECLCYEMKQRLYFKSINNFEFCFAAEIMHLNKWDGVGFNRFVRSLSILSTLD